MVKIQNRTIEAGAPNPTDQVLMSRHMLEASLMGDQGAGEEIASLKTKIKNLESECEARVREAKAAETEAEALRKQSEGFLLEYDRLLEDNQNLRNQLESIDQTLTESDGMKNM
ncbi:hypothetical protein GH714_032704 [Hevea brasiliensis]|uniref:Endoplasmic reticulum transmembrane protein n=1 Tax=Hevea brasiliensis TaxID=3981 RepID=A0A6A6KBS6_HEVBR|nr:hypothetical protein GH714_032704 [Hevea brasiliensis]